MSTPPVRRFMSPAPVTVAPGDSLSVAHRLMRDRGIRHLPVVEGGALVGVLSQRDVYLVETVEGLDPASETVGEAMSAAPYAVAPDAPLDAVALAMAERRIGSAVVVEGGRVVGLFTTVDALRALATVVRRRRSRTSEDAAASARGG